MPNGHREPYRFAGLARVFDSDDDGAGCPSPLHTSDSDDTYDNKRTYTTKRRQLVLLTRRWKKRARFLRFKRHLERLSLLPYVLRAQPFVDAIAKFLSAPPSQSMRP